MFLQKNSHFRFFLLSILFIVLHPTNTVVFQCNQSSLMPLNSPFGAFTVGNVLYVCIHILPLNKRVPFQIIVDEADVIHMKPVQEIERLSEESDLVVQLSNTGILSKVLVN